MRFDRHTVVLLSGHRTRPSCPTRSWRHYKTLNLASQAELHAQGYLLAAGPFNGQHDERLRGISVMSVDPEQARRLYAHDPAVGCRRSTGQRPSGRSFGAVGLVGASPGRAGRLAAGVMTWLVPAGSVRFESHHPPRSMAEAAED